MKNVVIVDSVRTGLAKSHRGGFNMTRPDDMLAHIINAMLERNPNLPPEAVEDVIMGCGNPEGAQGHNVGRNAAVLSNLPLTTGGTTINRYCSSGMQSISMAAGQIMAGCYDTVIAGGAETISMMNMNLDNFVNEKLAEQSPGIYYPMGMTAEVVAKRYNVSPSTLAIAWVSNNKSISAPIISASSLKQLNPSISALNYQMPSELYKEITSLSVPPSPATDRLEEI